MHDGAKNADLTLIGTYVTADFHLANDGYGGTFVTDPRTTPAAAPAATRFTQAVAGFGDGHAEAGLATIHAGGRALAASSLIATTTSGH